VRNLLINVWRIIRGDRMALIGVVLLSGIILISIFAPFIATHDPNAINERVEGVVVTFDGQEWLDPVRVADLPLNAAYVADEDLTFSVAVGTQGRIAERTDGDWIDLEPVTDASLLGVGGAAQGELVIAVGEGGAVLQRGGDGWAQVDAGSDVDLHDVAVMAADHAIAVGDGGTVLRLDDTEWSAVDVGVDLDLYGVRAVDADTAVAVGARGTILRIGRTSVDRVDSVTFRDLFGLDVRDDGAILAVGERGTILRNEATLSEPGDWDEMQSPESRTFEDVRYLDGGGALALGERGIAVRLSPGDDIWQQEDTGYDRGLRGIGAAGATLVAVGTDPFVNELAPPSSEHLFGTTHLGRDIYSQTIWGSRTALFVGLLAAVMVTLIGTNVGLVAGYFKGRVDNLLMRIVDVMYAIPFEPFALVLVLIFRPSLTIIVLAIGLLTWRTTARLIRSQVLSVSERPFVKAARVAGASDARILYVHIAPNVMPLVFLQLAVAMAFAITAEATLSFLGLGPPQVFSWGGILFEARLSGAWRTAWWWIIPPGLFIMVTVVAVFFISRALEVLTNPRLARR